MSYVMPIRRHPHARLLGRVSYLRRNLTAPAGLFAALAEVLDAPVVTTGARLARAPGIGADIVAFPG